MSPPRSLEKMSAAEMRAELVSLLSDGVLRYLAKRKVDRVQREPQFSAEFVEDAIAALAAASPTIHAPEDVFAREGWKLS